MTQEEKDLRKQLRLLLESKQVEGAKDKHGNNLNAISTTDVMRLILENKDISHIKYEIVKLRY